MPLRIVSGQTVLRCFESTSSKPVMWIFTHGRSSHRDATLTTFCAVELPLANPHTCVSSDVHCGHRLAFTEIGVKQNGHSFAITGASLFRRLICLISRNTANATIRKS